MSIQRYRCSFCGNPSKKVKILLVARHDPGIGICEKCVLLKDEELACDLTLDYETNLKMEDRAVELAVKFDLPFTLLYGKTQ